jgi:hypothetical protein
MRLLNYLETRLGERSFWGDIILAVSAAALLPKPWCYVFMGLSVLKALVPDAVKPA